MNFERTAEHKLLNDLKGEMGSVEMAGEDLSKDFSLKLKHVGAVIPTGSKAY